MQFIANYLKCSNSNIVGLKSRYTENGPEAIIYYLKEKVSSEEIRTLMSKDMITIHYSDGSSKAIGMPYGFDTKQTDKKP